MKRILVLALFLFLLAFGGNAWATGPQCGGNGPYYFCTQLVGIEAGNPDSVTDIGPLPYYGPNGSIAYYMTSTEQCQVIWNSPPYQEIAWADRSNGQTCNAFWQLELGIWQDWGANTPRGTYYAPTNFPKVP